MNEYSEYAEIIEGQIITGKNNKDIEIEQLKELLRECLDVFSNQVSPFYSYCQGQKYPCVDTEDFYQDTKAICKIIDKIDNAIGEKK